MCEATSGFKLCSCPAGNMGTALHNKNSRRHNRKTGEEKEEKIIWTLSEFAGKQDSGMDGMLLAPAAKLTELLTADYVQQELNSRNCFDFEYAPKEGDYLVLTFQRTKAEKGRRAYTYLPFIFRSGQWTVNAYDGFEDKTIELAKGKLEP
jgi:hypothetical protein